MQRISQVRRRKPYVMMKRGNKDETSLVRRQLGEALLYQPRRNWPEGILKWSDLNIPQV